jgi:hypothetical protein
LSTFSRKISGKEWLWSGDVTPRRKGYGKRKKPLWPGETVEKNGIVLVIQRHPRTFPHFSQTFPQAKIRCFLIHNFGAVYITQSDTLRQNTNFFFMHIFAEDGFQGRKLGLDKNFLPVFQKKFFKMGLILWK